MSSKPIWRVVQVVLVGAALGYFAYAVSGQWRDLAATRSSLHPDWWRMALSCVYVVVAYALLVETWRRTVVAWGGQLAWPVAARIWFVSNLGRYLPGKVWQIGAMGALAQAAGVSPVAAVGSSLVVNIVNILAACLVVALTGSSHLAGQGFLPGLAVGLAVAAATPWLLPRLARLAQRVSGRAVPEPRIPPAAILLALAGCSIAWTLYGLAFREFSEALVGLGAGTTSSYTAVFTLSYLAGYLALFAPGGIGVREVFLLNLLAAAGLASGATGALIVIASRLWLTVLEALPGLVLLMFGRTGSTSNSRPSNGT